MRKKFDIYDYKHGEERQLALLEKRVVSKKNRELIIRFYENCVVRNISVPRRIKCLEVLQQLVALLGKDFDIAKKEDIIKLVEKIQKRDDTPWTKHTKIVILKRFYKWFKGKDEEYPEEVKWIKNRIKRSEMRLPEEGDLLSEDDIKLLINNAERSRDKAIISVLYESGCRIGEIGSMAIRNVTFDTYGAVLVVSGKTGSRKIRLVSSTSYLMKWLENHPHKEDKESPLWVNIGTTNHNTPMVYAAFRALLKRLFNKTGIKKRFNPHIFRHSRATYLANHLTEFQMNQYFGWVQGSDMPSTYVHLSGRETDAAILELNGIKGEGKEARESSLKPKKCQRCDALNNHDSKFCCRCAAPLDIKTAIELEDKRQLPDNIMLSLIKDEEVMSLLLRKMAEKGMNTESEKGQSRVLRI